MTSPICSASEAPRTLNAGTCYQDIIEGIGKRLAIELFERTVLSVDEIAGRSGLADTSSFRKAFRKWTDQTRRTSGRFEAEVGGTYVPLSGRRDGGVESRCPQWPARTKG